MLFAVICADKPGHLNLRMETRPPHVEWLNGLNAAGQLKIAGPFLDSDGTPCGFDAPIRSYKGPEPHPLVPDPAVVNLKKAA